MSREQGVGKASKYYGPRTSDTGLGTTLGTQDVEKVLRFDFEAGALPAVDAEDAVVPVIPAGSLVTEARLEVLEAFSGGSVNKFDVGLYEPDGTVIDADGLMNDAPATTTGWSTGALGGPVATADAQVVVAALTSGDAASVPTAGKATLVVKYLQKGSV